MNVKINDRRVSGEDLSFTLCPFPRCLRVQRAWWRERCGPMEDSFRLV